LGLPTKNAFGANALVKLMLTLDPAEGDEENEIAQTFGDFN
jgi:hypothetical protein